MSIITVEEIEQDPQSFVNRVEAGESLVVVRGPDQIAEVKPIAAAPRLPRPYGLCAGQFSVPADFDEPLPQDMLAEFEGQ